uniref:Inositol hexakisphosphate and diphosphoinositol-pentakisphosphate kinase n=1 Tax=Rhipicephalus zambeziensis TaxID=60191 RepID=A0A224YRR0_9ACAR
MSYYGFPLNLSTNVSIFHPWNRPAVDIAAYWRALRCDTEHADSEDESLAPGKQVLVGICAMAKKSQSKPMKEILTRLEEFEYIKTVVFPEEVILNEPVEEWPLCDCLVSFHSKGFPLNKAIEYAELRNPFIVNDLFMQYDIQDRRKVYSILEGAGIELPRYAVLDRESTDERQRELVEGEDHVEVNGVTFNKPFVEKPISAEDHNIYIYYPTSAGGGSQRLFRKIGSRSSVYSPESRVRKTGSFIYEEFMPTDGTDVKVYTVGPDYAHAEARKSPALDGKVERDKEGKEVRYPVILTNTEKLIARKVCLAFKQTVCGFDLLRANGKSYVCDVNGFSFVKNSMKYYDDCAKILGNMILRELAPQLHIPWSMPFQLDDPPIVPTTFGKMMELRCVIAVIRHGDRTPKQKMKMEVKHPKFFELFEHYGGFKDGHIKLKKPKQLQEILDISRFLLSEIEHKSDPEVEENKAKLEQLKSVLEMYGHFSGINRKVQLKYQPKGRPRHSSSDEDYPREPSLVLILKWGGELTPAGRVQAEELGRVFRCMYPGGQGLGLLRLHSTFRHDLKIYASDEGRVQMTAAAFAKGLLALEGELTPILVQMVKSANTNGLLDNDCDSSKYQNIHYRVKQRLHEAFQVDHDFTEEDFEKLNPTHARSIQNALQFIKNPVKACQHVYEIIQDLIKLIKCRKDESKTHVPLYHGETWELMLRRWAKLEKDFKLKNGKFDISKIPDVYDCIKYDLQHNQHTLQFVHAEELYLYAKALADVVIPQEYGLNLQEKLTIGLGICTPLLKKIRADLHRNIDPAADETESVNRLNPQYSHGVSSPGRHVRTRLYFTSESHIHSLLTVLRYGGLLDETKDEQWRRAMEYVNAVTELNYMTQIVIMLYEDPTKDQHSEERFHVELHFSPGVVCCVQKNLPPGPGFRPQSRSGPREKSSEKGMLGAASHEAGEKHGCIEEEEDELTFDDEGRYEEVWSDHESPTILDDGNSKEAASVSRASASVVPPFLSSQPIPIGKVLQCMAMEAPGDEHLRPYPIVRCNSDSQRPRSLDSDAAEPPKVDKGQLSSYLRICSVADLPKVFGSSGSLFSTAVISGSSSAPDLKNLFPTAVADGIVSVPSIRPLETLHNALSLHQLDQFLGKVTSATYRMLLSSVPKAPGSMYSNSQFSALPVASPSSSMIWSGPPSFVSSSGPSTPTSSTLDIWTKLHQMNENESSAAESSGTTSRNSYSTPPSPHDPRYYNNSL